MRSHALHSLRNSLIFGTAYRFAEFPWLWFSIALFLVLAAAIAWLSSMMLETRPDLVPKSDTPIEERLDRLVRSARRLQPLTALLILAWLYSWRWAAA
jgi:hypothetical protein